MCTTCVCLLVYVCIRRFRDSEAYQREALLKAVQSEDSKALATVLAVCEAVGVTDTRPLALAHVEFWVRGPLAEAWKR